MGSTKKTIAVVASLVMLGVGLVVGVLLVRQRQLLQKEAAVPGGVAQVWLSPEQRSVGAGETFTVDIVFSTGGRAISGVVVSLNYPYTGTEPPLSVSDIQLNTSEGFSDSSQWSFPVKQYSASGGVAQIKLAGANITTDGYSADASVTLATLTFSADLDGSATASFDAVQSKITDKLTAEDVLLIPTSVGTYQVAQAATGTPTPTEPAGTTTLTPTSSPGPTSTSTSTPTPTGGTGGGDATSTPTPTEQLVDAGVELPTVVMMVFGLLMIIGGWLLLLG